MRVRVRVRVRVGSGLRARVRVRVRVRARVRVRVRRGLHHGREDVVRHRARLELLEEGAQVPARLQVRPHLALPLGHLRLHRVAPVELRLPPGEGKGRVRGRGRSRGEGQEWGLGARA